MSDLISRKAAIDMCRKPHMRNADCSDFEMEIMMLPSVQPEIIRCKDCKYADDDGVCQNSIGLVIQDDDDFCSRAERREE